MKLDEIDIKILATLQTQGRITKVALSEAVHLSPTPCWERLKKLEGAGLIVGYRAEIAAARLAPHTVILTQIHLASHTQQDFQRFEAAMVTRPEVMAVWATGGGVDYFLKIMTRDINAYQALMEQFLDQQIGIDRYFTYVVTKQVKESGEVPLTVLLD